MIKPRTMKGPFPVKSPYGEIGRSGSPLAYLIDPGAGSASDHVQRQWPTVRNLEDITRRGGDITPLYAAVDDYSPMFGEAITGRTPADRPNIPRTRAAITGYKKRPWDGSGVWASNDTAGVPIYETTAPYEKVPAEIRMKEFHEITPAETILYVRAADRADHDLDRMIWYKFFFDPAIAKGDDSYLKLVGRKHGWYTHSLDAALSLYLIKPSSISTDILDVCVAALEQRLDPSVVKFAELTQ